MGFKKLSSYMGNNAGKKEFIEDQLQIIRNLHGLFANQQKDGFRSYLEAHPETLKNEKKEDIVSLLGEKMDPLRRMFALLGKTTEEELEKAKEKGEYTEAFNNVMMSYHAFAQELHQWKNGLSAEQERITKSVFSALNPPEPREMKNTVSMEEFLFRNVLVGMNKRVRDTDFNQNSHNRMVKMNDDEPIFPQGVPKPSEVLQEFNGSCYMLSALRNIAEINPKFIENMIHDNKNGTVTVRLFQERGNFRIPLEVTVDKSLPKTDKQSAPWVRLFEKAYVASGLKQYGRNFQPGVEGIDMRNLGWYPQTMFLNHILPTTQETKGFLPNVNRLTNFEDVKNAYLGELKKAVADKAIVTFSTKKHAMTLESFSTDEKTGKTYVNYFDQYKKRHGSVPFDDVFSTTSSFDGFDIGYMDGPRVGTRIQMMTRLDAEKYAKKFNYITKTDLTTAIVESFTDKLDNVSRANDTQFSADQIKQLKKLLKNGKAVKALAAEEFARFENRNTQGDIDAMLTPGNPRYLDMISRVQNAVTIDLQGSTLPLAQTTVGLVNKVKEYQAALHNRAVQKAVVPEKQSENPYIERIYALQQTLQQAQERSSKNSIEFTAMADAVSDLCEAYRNEVQFSQDTIRQLEERAYAKCNFYQRSKNPYTDEGKLRKNTVIDFMRVLQEKRPSIRESLYHSNGREMELELACQLARQLTDEQMGVFSESTKKGKRTQNLIEILGDGKNSQKQYIKELAAELPMRSGWDTYEKACTKKVLEPIALTMKKKALTILAGINSPAPEAVTMKAVKKQLGVGQKSVPGAGK